eukprot:g29775.t1
MTPYSEIMSSDPKLFHKGKQLLHIYPVKTLKNCICFNKFGRDKVTDVELVFSFDHQILLAACHLQEIQKAGLGMWKLNVKLLTPETSKNSKITTLSFTLIFMLIYTLSFIPIFTQITTLIITLIFMLIFTLSFILSFTQITTLIITLIFTLIFILSFTLIRR